MKQPRTYNGKRGFSRAVTLMQKSIRGATETRGFAQTRVLTHWPEIVGEAMAKIANPVDVSYAKGGFGATLTVLTSGAQAPMLEMQKEQIREKVLAGTLEKQRMLVPEPVALRPAEAAAVLEQAELLKGLGIEVEPFGGDTVLVASYPAMLSNQNPAEVLKGVIEKLMGEAKNLDQRDLVDELLHMISCKAAIKAGDKLTPEEIEALLEQRELCQDGHHCPHGRPTSLTFSREELDKKFKRI